MAEEEKLNWAQRRLRDAANAARAAAGKVTEATGNVVEGAGNVVGAVRDSELVGNVVEGAGNAAGAVRDSEFVGNVVEGAGNVVEGVQNSGVGTGLTDTFLTVAGKLGEVTRPAIERAQSAISDGLNSDASQNFIQMAGDKITAAQPLAGAVIDSVKDIATDPSNLTSMGVQGIGAAILSGGMNIPATVAIKVMQDPDVQAQLGELLGVDLDDIEGLDKLSQLSNSQLAGVLKDPSLLGVLQTAMETPQIQTMLQNQLDNLSDVLPDSVVAAATSNIVQLGANVLMGKTGLSDVAAEQVMDKLMENPSVRGTLGSVLGIDVDTAEGQETLANLSEGDLKAAMADPVMRDVIDDVMDTPEVQEIIQSAENSVSRDGASLPSSTVTENIASNTPPPSGQTLG